MSVLLDNAGLDKFWSLSRVCLMSRICPIHVLFMSRICPCLMFVRTLSRKSNFCPLQIQFLSSNPHFVQYLSSFFGIIPQKFARQTLDNFLTSSLYHLQPGYPAFGQNLDKLRILVFHETEWSWTKIGLQNPEFVQEPSKKSWIITIFRQVRLG